VASERRTCAIAIALAALFAAAPALAEPDPAEREMARNLMDEGDRRLEAKDVAGALEKYKLADSIMGVPSTGIDVAKTDLALGRLFDAWEAAVKITRYPRKPGEPEAFTRARREAEGMVEKLAPRIPSLRVSVEGPPKGAALQATLDGDPVPAESLTEPRKVNPGRHVVVVSSPGYSPATATTTLGEGQSSALVLNLTVAPPERVTPVEPPGRSPLVYIGFGAGAAGVLVGSITGILSLTTTSSLKSRCPAGRCPASAEPDLARANTLANVANVSFAVGLAGALAGVVGVVLSNRPAPRPAAPPAQAILFAAPAPGGGVLGLAGRF
jgi:hypothetical protein